MRYFVPNVYDCPLCVWFVLIYPKKAIVTQVAVQIHDMFDLSAAGVYKYHLITNNTLNAAKRQELATINLEMPRLVET